MSWTAAQNPDCDGDRSHTLNNPAFHEDEQNGQSINGNQISLGSASTPNFYVNDMPRPITLLP